MRHYVLNQRSSAVSHTAVSSTVASSAHRTLKSKSINAYFCGLFIVPVLSASNIFLPDPKYLISMCEWMRRNMHLCIAKNKQQKEKDVRIWSL